MAAEIPLGLGLQATHLIMESDEPLATLKLLSQDFPRYASSLARRVTPSDNVTDEASINSMRFQGGNAIVWMNGAIVPADRMNPFRYLRSNHFRVRAHSDIPSLIRLLRKEEDVMLSLTSLGLSPNASFELIAHPKVDAPYAGSDILEGIFDASDREEGGGLITWLNNLEKDDR
jgi:UDP-glucose:glycoprotein glucosyltransferase